ncbi:hypothetical protein UlMin_026617 [Ulmus minor]
MEPSLCVEGCGFYGITENRNMCSKCYQNFLKQEMFSKFNNLTTREERRDADDNASSTVTTSVENLSCEKKRCDSCNKKVGLTGITCRCGNLFCGRHRLPEVHKCNFDYKSAAREVLTKQNPVCKADKLQRI